MAADLIQETVTRTRAARGRRSVAGLVAMLMSLALAAADVSAAVPRRTRRTLAEGTRWVTRYHIQDSGAPGATVVVTAGIHGNEPAGTYAADAIRHWPIQRGKLIVLPRANVPALRADSRKTPDVEKTQADLNRNFPRARKKEAPRGSPAREIWQLVVRHKPDWLLDLHESFDFRQINKKAVGSSIIARSKSANNEVVSAMLAAVNAAVGDKSKQFIRLSPPASGSLARGAIEHLGARAMMLETGRKETPLSVRARQHRILVHALLRHLRMIDESVRVDHLTGPRAKSGPICVALYDAGGAGGRGIPRLLRLLGDAEGTAVLPIGPPEIQNGALGQFDVVIFPGGSGSKQARALGTAGRDQVRKFVRNGGGYVGICAGAYLAASGFSWGLKILDARTVSPKWRRGKGTVKIELTQRGREILGGPRGQFDVRYHNGPILKPAGSKLLDDYVPLAVFRTELAENDTPKGVMINSPALLCGRYAKGRVLCSSPHPEQHPALDAMVLRAVAWAAGRSPSTVRAGRPVRPTTRPRQRSHP